MAALLEACSARSCPIHTGQTTRLIHWNSDDTIQVEWTIRDFLSQCTMENGWIQSCIFSFLGHWWNFCVCRSKNIKNEEVYCINIGRKTSETECKFKLIIEFEREDGKEQIMAWKLELGFLKEESEKIFSFPSFKRNAIRKRASVLLPAGNLTLKFLMMT